MEMLLRVKFNRPVNLDEDYIVAGGFAMVMNGKDVEFDFHNQYHNLVEHDSSEDVITLYNPDYEDFPEFENISVDDLKNVTKIEECFVYLGEPGESDLKVEEIKDICFEVFDDKYETISVDSTVIEEFNSNSKKNIEVL